MERLRLAPVNDAGRRLIEAWFEDPELARRLSPPDAAWWLLQHGAPGVELWLAWQGQEAVGYVQGEPDERDPTTFHFAFAVRPGLRGRGYGKRILRAMLEHPSLARYRRFVASVEPDNHASLRCLGSQGFTRHSRSPDENGFVDMAYTRHYHGEHGGPGSQ
ncbi:GNAT family N-acetyltransferase [Calidithermus roseus]|uniref:Diaminobutyrate acetyltransferase n=1 Tax=Calidithermus roseus TaxID=1644118 RepID=A0A399EZL9_9DEIN|nr:GNAT family N-acetyltransferase [Calidithermus roseus]RIH89478.1 diaminobutyrate acetyltransferase [Calidithermus roseus]